jgi:hypothetical protein
LPVLAAPASCLLLLLTRLQLLLASVLLLLIARLLLFPAFLLFLTSLLLFLTFLFLVAFLFLVTLKRQQPYLMQVASEGHLLLQMVPTSPITPARRCSCQIRRATIGYHNL